MSHVRLIENYDASLLLYYAMYTISNINICYILIVDVLCMCVCYILMFIISIQVFKLLYIFSKSFHKN